MLHIIPELLPSLLLTLPFLVAFAALRLILWGPLMQYLDDCETATEGARLEAAEFETQAENRMVTIESRLADARVEAIEITAAARTRALAKEAEILAAARSKAEERLATAHAKLADERLAAKVELEANARALSTDIVQTLLA